jgi:hypothetical protein
MSKSGMAWFQSSSVRAAPSANRFRLGEGVRRVNRKLPLINHLTVLHYFGLADYWLTPFTKVVCLGEPFLYFRFRHTFRQMRPTTQVSASYQDYYSFIWWPGAIYPSESWLHTGIVALAAVYMLAMPCSMIAICCSLV